MLYAWYGAGGGGSGSGGTVLYSTVLYCTVLYCNFNGKHWAIVGP
jgi:hypothetical protein